MDKDSDQIIGSDVELCFFANGFYGHKVGLRLDDEFIKVGTLPWLVMVRIYCHTQDEHGFPTPQEQPALSTVPQRAFDASARHETRYFLRSSSNGVRTFYFYAKDGPKVVQEIVESYAGFTEYRVETECQEDAEWKFYFSEVHPLLDFEREKQLLLAVLHKLNEVGDELTRTRTFDHGVRFPDIERAVEFSKWAVNNGFDVGSPQIEEAAEEYFVDISRSEVPDWKFVNGTLYEIVLAAARFGGKYSSNGCMAVLDQNIDEEPK